MSAEADRQSQPSFGLELRKLTNGELLDATDQVLLELERRLLRYAQSGGELQQMADEGLLLSTRAAARLQQAQSAAVHAQGHLQIVGVGSWTPSSTRPAWNEDPRVREAPDDQPPSG